MHASPRTELPVAPSSPCEAAAATHTTRRSATWSRLVLSAELIGYEVQKTHVGSVLGMAWAVIYPLLFLGLYVFFFAALGVEPGGRDAAGEQLLVLLAALVPWFFFSHAIAAGMVGLLNHAQLVSQVNFPVGVVPFVAVGPHAVDFVIGMGLLAILTVATGVVSWSLFLILPLAPLLCAFVVAISSLLAPAVVMLRDLRKIIPLALRAGLFLSPVLYLPSALPAGFDFVTYVNPMTYFISVAREASLPGSETGVLGPFGDLGVAAGITAITVLVAWTARSLNRRVIDYL